MAFVIPALTVDDLNQFPDDGMRREIIAGELYVAAAPKQEHQEVAGNLYSVLRNAVMATGWGKVYFSPVDVQFSDRSLVQPDLIVLRQDHLDRYQGHTVFGPPDVVVEILSPSNRAYDLIEKAHLYALQGVPEYWIADPDDRSFQLLALVDSRYVPVEPVAGRFPSAVVPDLLVDPAVIFTGLPDS